MTKKDYIKLAKCIKNARGATLGNEDELNGIRLVIRQLVQVLHEDNSNFNEDTFLEACK